MAAMTKRKRPGAETCLDPNEIARIEIFTKDNQAAIFTMSLRGRQGPTVMKFASRKEAIEFYEAIWRRRRSGTEQVVEVGDLG